MDVDFDLVGKTITEIRKSIDGTFLDFVADGTRLRFEVEGTSSKESWWAHASGIQNLLNSRINRIRQISKISDLQRKEAIFAYEFYTDKGICSFEMRSNGGDFYEGSLARSSKEEPQNMQVVTRDF